MPPHAHRLRTRTAILALVIATDVVAQPSKPIIDVFIASDEVEMVRYRLRLHEPFARKTIIVESSHNHIAMPKPLHMRNSLSEETIRRHNIVLIDVQFGEELLQQVRNCTSGRKCVKMLEVKQRMYMNQILEREAAAAGDALIYMSDVDELLDGDSLPPVTSVQIPTCATPLMRMYVYGELCAAVWPLWAKAVLFNASSGWLQSMVKEKPDLQLRNMVKTCPSSRSYMGWHLTYFTTTSRVLNKLRTFSHSTEKFVRAITSPKNGTAEAEIERRISKCKDVRSNRMGPLWSAFDGRLPPLPGWPRHPLAPTTLSIPRLRELRNKLVADVAKTKAARERGWHAFNLNLTEAELRRAVQSGRRCVVADEKSGACMV